jgi:hypothetical protein
VIGATTGSKGLITAIAVGSIDGAADLEQFDRAVARDSGGALVRSRHRRHAPSSDGETLVGPGGSLPIGSQRDRHPQAWRSGTMRS